MAEVRSAEAIEIAAPPEKVFALRLDFDSLPAYNPDVSDLKRMDGGSEPGVGATYSLTSNTEYGSVPGTLTVTEVEPPARIVDEMDFGLKAREVCSFSPAAKGTRVQLELTVLVPDDLDQAGRSFIEENSRRQLRMELENMRTILEG